MKTAIKTSPVSASARPMPRHNKRALECVQECILLPSGVVRNIMLDERYTPYSRQGARIENLCGSFTEYVSTTGLGTVICRNGGQKELFHVHGNVVVNQGKGAFMAARGFACLSQLARALRLSGPSNVVHMAVITSRLGKRAQVSAHGLLEANLARQSELVRVNGRIYEQTNAVRFNVVSFAHPPFDLPAQYIPDKNDWTITGKGMVIIRLIWRQLEWTQEGEDACLQLCDRATEWLRGCC